MGWWMRISIWTGTGIRPAENKWTAMTAILRLIRGWRRFVMTGRTTTAMVWWTWRSLYVSAKITTGTGMISVNRISTVMMGILR